MPGPRHRAAVGRARAPRRPAVLILAGLLSFAVPAAVAEAEAAQDAAQPSRDPYAAPVAEAAQRFGIPIAWIRTVMLHESGGDPRAVSPKGAMGLMQVMPATWATLRVRHALGSDPFDPRDNILAGTAFLRAMHDRYGTVAAMLAAYSAGPTRADQWLAGRPLPPETRAYVAAVAPKIGGGAEATAPAAPPPDPLAWTRAPLFVARSDPARPADGAQPERRVEEAAGVVPVRETSAVPQRSGLLFARSDRGEGR